MSDLEKLRGEFLAESEDTLEQLQRDVDSLERGGNTGDPELIDRAFRTVHSLKGVCGMFGLDRMTEAAHALENVFDAIRSGAVSPDAGLMDGIHQGVELLFGLLAHATGRRADEPPVSEIARKIESALEAARGAAPEPAAEEGDPVARALAGLTPGERDALRDAARAGRTVALVRSSLPADAFQDPFRDLLAATRTWGSVHGTVTQEFPDNTFQVALAVSGTNQIFHLMKAVGPLGAEVASVEPAALAPAGAADVPAPAAAAAPAPSAVPPPSNGSPSDPDPAPTATVSLLRVPVDRVDRLLSDLGDVVHAKMALDALADRVLSETPDRVRRTEFLQSLRSLDRRIRSLQSEILRIRMVTLGPLFQKLERAVREACRVTGKEARFVARGENVELDKSIVEALVEPLVHLVRNAVDHGIEPPVERARAGKDPTGRVMLEAVPEHGQIVLRLSDDGRGLDYAAILRKARERGIFAPSDEPGEAELRDVIFRSGFTVRDEAGELSGRGVGLDAVREAVADLGGTLGVEADPRGTCFRLRIPATLAVTQALAVQAGGQTYFLPLASVHRVTQVAPRAVETVAGADRVLLVADRAVPVADLGELLHGIPCLHPDRGAHGVLVQAADRSRMLLVEAVGRQREIVVRAIHSAVPDSFWFTGSTELADGRTVLILDPGAFFEDRPLEAATEAAS